VNHVAERKEAYRKALQLGMTLAIGRDALKSIYTVVYGCDWDLIENIINPLLGGTWWQLVFRIASAAEVKESAISKRMAS